MKVKCRHSYVCRFVGENCRCAGSGRSGGSERRERLRGEPVVGAAVERVSDAAHVLVELRGGHQREVGRSGGRIARVADRTRHDQTHLAAALPQNGRHLFAAHPAHVHRSNLQDVVARSKVALLLAAGTRITTIIAIASVAYLALSSSRTCRHQCSI